MAIYPERLPFILKSGGAFRGMFTFAYILLKTYVLKNN